jgi:3-oxoacyl-[acyl-carrier-protein] synthase III
MRYQKVCLEAIGYTLPEEVVTTVALERLLDPVYQRLRLPQGRLELMTGIEERRFFPPETLPSQVSIQSGRQALQISGIDPGQIGALIHGSVCRDHLEPATACHVHHHLGLPAECLIYDVSNACLGILTGMIQVANMIELGQIRAGLIVGTECGRELVENTISKLNNETRITRREIKSSIASLTIGSGSVAVLLCDKQLSQTQNGLLGASVLARTDHRQLCQSDGLQSFMSTDSEQLMHQGIAAGAETFGSFLNEIGWTRRQVDKTICHQVGVAHRRQLLEALDMAPNRDYATLETLGNTGAVALPLTLALGAEAGHLQPTDRVALLGIGSGINCQMLAIQWQRSLVQGRVGIGSDVGGSDVGVSDASPRKSAEEGAGCVALNA